MFKRIRLMPLCWPSVFLALGPLAGCRVLEPDYFEATPYMQRGDNSFDRPVSNFEEETYGLAFTLGWNIGVQHEAMRNLAALDVSKAGELAVHRHGGETVVNVEQSQEQEAENIEEVSALEGAAGGGPLSWLPPLPRTLDEAYPWLIGVFGIGFLLWVLGHFGMLGRLIPKKRSKE